MAAKRKAKKTSTASAVAVGKRLAAETLKRRKQAVVRRNAVLAKAAARPRMRAAAAIAPPRTAFARTLAAAAPSAGTLVAEGDSWFDYPFYDVLSILDDKYGFDVESVAHKGDTVEHMAYGKGELDAFSRRIEKVVSRKITPRAILLSGGGNDVAGDEFAMLLNHALSGIAGLNDSIVTGVIEERARDAYVVILKAITDLCKDLVGRTVPIVIHGYDYPVPDGRGFWGGGWILPGPWLEPAFLAKGYEAMAARMPICREMIDRFNTMLASIAGKAPFTHVKHLDLRNTLRSDATYEEYWGNELHPTKKGFEMVAAKFAAVV
jgi:lysophospholipase L1-like esterase